MDLETPSTPPVAFIRPYRSHRVPACNRCRQRKSRCMLDLPGQPCRFCRERHLTCNYVSIDPVTNVLHSNKSAKKRPRQVGGQSGQSERDNVHIFGVSQPSSEDLLTPAESSIMMDPNMAEDIAMLEHYLSGSIVKTQAKRSYNTIAQTSGPPVVYLTVPRKRKGLKLAADPGRTQREIMEQVLSPFAADVRKLYFDHLHPCFPILDEKTFHELWSKDSDRISSALLCDIYAAASLFWTRSEILRPHPRPDLDFLWNTAVTALSDDFLAPTISTVYAALLDMVGRPVGAVTGNIVNVGRVVTLAQSLGLHRDPSTWKTATHEKSARICLWWGIRIHDHWSSIGHGIPPTINPHYSDVLLPDLELLTSSITTISRKNAISTFFHLCKLTQILGDILPLVYALGTDVEQSWRSLRKAECALDDWVMALPGCLRVSDPSLPRVNGSSNLWFAYLSVKALVCRLALKLTLETSEPSPEARQYRLSTLRSASCEVVDFVITLQEGQLQEFWLPYTSYLLVTATTILLRCTIECGDLQTKKECVLRLLKFRDRLSRAKNDSGWDLADSCLERCAGPIQKMADVFSVSAEDLQSQASRSQVDTPRPLHNFAGNEGHETFLTMESLDYSWDALWETLEGPWNTLESM